MVICLERGADCLHMVQLMPLHPKTQSSLASFKSRLVLLFWCQLTQVVPEKKLLNVCSSSSSSLLATINFVAEMSSIAALIYLSIVGWLLIWKAWICHGIIHGGSRYMEM